MPLKMQDIITSLGVRVKIEVEPKRVVQTSPERFVFGEKIFISKYPKASDVVEINARPVSPFIFEFFSPHKRITAKIVVTGRTKYVGAEIFKTEARASAPKAVWLRPSPIKENFLRTKVTPNNEEQSAMTTPVITA